MRGADFLIGPALVIPIGRGFFTLPSQMSGTPP